jgi:hypothetical protein
MKIVVALLVVAAVGWQFAKILKRPELWERPVRPNGLGLALAAAAYMLCFICWGAFWRRLIESCGGTVSWLAAGRAYFISQLGKYVPGKALAILIRVTLARAAGVRTDIGAITATYETLTSMAAGAMVAALLTPLLIDDDGTMQWRALGLLVIAGIPILPGVFNRIAARLAKPFLRHDAPAVPQLRFALLIRGLGQSAIGWGLLGASLLAVSESLYPGAIPITFRSWGICTASVSMGYVAGFIALFVPGGLGVREVVIQQLLSSLLAESMPTEAQGAAVFIVLVLRLVWTSVEVVAAGSFFGHNRLSQRLTPAPA